jgi:hypothetical protein
MLCFLIFADNVLRRIEGPGETMWFWLRPGRWELIFVSGVLSVCAKSVPVLMLSAYLCCGRRTLRPGSGLGKRTDVQLGKLTVD